MEQYELRINTIVDFIQTTKNQVEQHIIQYKTAMKQKDQEYKNLNELVGTFLFGLNICVGNLRDSILIHRKIMKMCEDRMDYVEENEELKYKIKEDDEIRMEKQGEAYRVICKNIKDCYDYRESQLKCLVSMMKSEEWKMIDNIEDSIREIVSVERLKRLTDTFLKLGEYEIIRMNFD